ncbi:MAG: hypothetical protein MAG451_01707 [Anaerolineales bacterium]|nr:hypothetical protein [Anaerolineales bacterium]
MFDPVEVVHFRFQHLLVELFERYLTDHGPNLFVGDCPDGIVGINALLRQSVLALLPILIVKTDQIRLSLRPRSTKLSRSAQGFLLSVRFLRNRT